MQPPTENNPQPESNISGDSVKPLQFTVSPKPKRPKRAIAFIVLGVILLLSVSAAAARFFIIGSQSGQSNTERQSSDSGYYQGKSYRDDKVEFAKSDSSTEINKRLGFLQAHIEKVVNTEEWSNDSFDSPGESTSYQTWCKLLPAATRPSRPTRCHDGVGVSQASGYSQAINIVKSAQNPQLEFTNRYNAYDFTYVEAPDIQKNRFSLFFQDKQIPFVVTTRLSIGAQLEGFQLDVGNVAQGPTQPTLKSELAQYTQSAEGLRTYATAQLDRLREKAKNAVSNDGFKKYVECRTIERETNDYPTGIAPSVEPGEECKKANLSDTEKAMLTANLEKEIDRRLTGLITNYNYIYNTLIQSSFAKDCSECWQ